MNTRPRAILVIEEEPVMRESLTMVLEDEGYRCLTASDAGDALGLLEREEVDLVLLDLATVCSRPGPLFVRIHQRHPDLPVLLVSHYDDRESLVPLLRQGAAGYIFKPIDFEELIAALPTYLG